jgi:hypothetical protein
MKTYVYYNKLDKTQEPQGKIFDADNRDDAAFQAAFRKQMNIDDFLNTFEVKEVYERKVQKSKRVNRKTL